MLRVVADALAGGVTTVQLRRKGELGRRFVELGHALREMTYAANALLMINDRVDVAMLIGADGVHVGQDDISCADARRLLPDKWIGVSARTVEQALAAQSEGADYLGVGAAFTTHSKVDATHIGLDGIRRIVSAVNLPAVGIGGITQTNAAAVLATGTCGIAIVSAIMSAPSPRQAAESFNKLFTPIDATTTQ